MMHDLAILGYGANYYRPIFRTLENEPGVHLLSPPWNTRQERLIYFVRIHQQLKNARLPGLFPTSAPVCCMFFRDWYWLVGTGYLDMLRKAKPATKAVWYFSDLVANYPGIDMAMLRQKFDLLLSFDPQDAEEYGLVHCPLPYSLPSVPQSDGDAVQSDVVFLGKAKQRLDRILSVYETLRDAGLRCDFHIADADPSMRRWEGEIDYCDFMPYEEYLCRVYASRCVLEVVQDPSHSGWSWRTYEAVTCGRRLLSDNPGLFSAPFYDPRQICIFSDPGQIDLAFFYGTPPAPQPELFSPRKFLDTLETRLGIHINMNK